MKEPDVRRIDDLPAKMLEEWRQYYKVRAWENEQEARKAKRGGR